MIESTIFANLIFNEEYARKVIPFLKNEYFQDRIHQTLFNIINKFVMATFFEYFYIILYFYSTHTHTNSQFKK